jgi:hypothetical protein
VFVDLLSGNLRDLFCKFFPTVSYERDLATGRRTKRNSGQNGTPPGGDAKPSEGWFKEGRLIGLLNVGYFPILKRDLHVFEDIDFLSPKIDHTLGLA